MIPFFEKSAMKFTVFSRFICGFFLLISLSYFANAGNEWVEQQDLSKNWYIYSPSWKTYLPYVASKHFSYQSKSLLFDTHQTYDAFLQIKPQEDFQLFLNGVYQKRLSKGSEYLLNLDSLMKPYRQNQTLIFTIYAKNLKGFPAEIKQLVKGNQGQNGFLNYLSRPSSLLNNFFLVSTILVLFLFSVVFRYFPRNFNYFFRFSDWINFNYKEDAVLVSVFAFPNILMVFGLSLLTSFVAFYHSILDPIESAQLKLGSNVLQAEDALLFVAQKSILAFVMFYGRYLVYYIFTSLFKIEQLAKPHFFKSVQANIQFFSILYFGLFLIYFIAGSAYQPSLEQISFLVDAYFLVRVVYFYFLFKNSFNLNNISLAAYLLFMEGQVVFFGIRQLIFPNYI